MELSQLIGKPVLSPAGEALGCVKCAYVFKNELSGLLCFDRDEEEFFLPSRALLSFGDAVIAEPCRTDGQRGEPFPVGKPVFDEWGRFLGAACAMETGEHGVLTVFPGGKTELCFPLSALSFGEAVIVYETRRPPRKKTTRMRQNAIQVAKTEPNAEEKTGALPSTGLLGKQVKKPVCWEDETLARAGETVTPALLKRAREHNRLLELAAHTLTE